MFAYGLNNPVNMSDEYGCMPRGYYGVDGIGITVGANYVKKRIAN